MIYSHDTGLCCIKVVGYLFADYFIRKIKLAAHIFFALSL